ncbi:MAG TPA: glyoxylate/hydroxypyruvate reductase A [Thermohalobaculum sp.]|nr:glyoxylate/hydroxypyruvate reductase A [Thermohalobaculum sp.]
MPPVVVYAGRADQREVYERHLIDAAAAAGLAIDLRMDPARSDPAGADYLVFAANGPVRDFTPYTRLKGILSLWAGVENILKLDPPADVPLVRMVEEGMTLGMIDYVMGHVLRHHLDIDRYIDTSPIAEWETAFPPLASERKVGVLGLGALGAACAGRLAAHGFRVIGWSRTQKDIRGVACRTGDFALDETIAESEILVLLLPFTPDTHRVLNARRIAQMPLDACLINPARGQLVDHAALLAALHAGLLRHATMDVFDVEPLPPDDPYWFHPRVTVTPHIASGTRPRTASRSIIEQIARHERGEAFTHVVDRARGY